MIEVKRDKKEIDKTKLMGKILKDAAKEYIDTKANRVLESIKDNIPVDTGKLKNNVHRTPLQEVNDIITVEFKTEGIPYAVRVHEDPNFIAKRPSPTKEGGIGNKFMERASRYHYKNDKELVEITKRITGISLIKE
jgi:hypothetical protein